jgi:hypothetical protein
MYLKIIASQNITGPLPVELSLFPSIALVDLSWNLFTGSLPFQYATSGMAEALISLDLHANQLTGTIPDVYWTRMTNLIQLNLGVNSLTENIWSPSTSSSSSLEKKTIGRFLVFLGLYANLFTGSIPSALLEKCTALTELWLNDNLLSGTIPSAVGNLTNLGAWLLGIGGCCCRRRPLLCVCVSFFHNHLNDIIYAHINIFSCFWLAVCVWWWSTMIFALHTLSPTVALPKPRFACIEIPIWRVVSRQNLDPWRSFPNFGFTRPTLGELSPVKCLDRR